MISKSHLLRTPLTKRVTALLAIFALTCSATAREVSRPVTGIASYYGRTHQGHRMANGHRFDRHKLTGACRRFPLGSVVRVTNLKNHRSVVVEITDRGPYIKHRVIDLSEAAARSLGLYHRGVAMVRIVRIR
jgi:rare lipoprotein A